MTRGNYWRDGKCKRGHDITDPRNVQPRANGRACRLCQLEHAAASRIRTGVTKSRREARQSMVEDVGPEPTAEPNRQPTPAEVARMLDLFRRDEHAPPWEAKRLRELAESIRDHGLPASDDGEASRAYQRAQHQREKSGVAKRAARRDGGADAVGRDAKALRQDRDGSTRRPVSSPVPQVVEGLGGDPESIRQDGQAVAGGAGVEQGLECLGCSSLSSRHAGAG